MLKAKQFNALNYKQVKINVLANLFRLLVDIYGHPKAKKNLSKIEGKEIYVNLPDLNGGIIFKPYGGRVLGTPAFNLDDSEKPSARLNLKVKDEKIFDVLEKIIKMKSNNWSFVKIFFKYILTGKIGLSIAKLSPIVTLFKCLMIGDHPMYEEVDIRELGKEKRDD
ncbi:MAG: hypothetical protein GF329_13240 [Candidatus Lokiarchaeota archaeon]|nr:hypothetical protein [Candidatus Lokiarchaeota archaeon]